MRKLIEYFFIVFFRLILSFRYRIRFKGLDKLSKEALKKPGGVLFLPNHPSVFVDPISVALGIWPRFPIRPMIVEYFYYQPIVHVLMKFVRALPVPNFDVGSNSLKRKKSEEVVQEVIKDLKKGDNFLIYPAGRTKQTAFEAIGGASAVHRIVQEAPEANIVLVRTKGLWGSMFSRAFIGKAPPLFPTLLQGVKYVLMNLIFFTPRREIIVEFELPPADFPYKASRLEFNRWLERWYNKPDGLTTQVGAYPGDSLVLIPYTIWSKKLPEPWKQDKELSKEFDIEKIPVEIQEKIILEIAKITEMKAGDIKPEMAFDTDLGMDSLDVAELISFIQDYYDLKSVNPLEMTTVGRAMAIAAKIYVCQEEPPQVVGADSKKWFKKVPREKLRIPEGQTIPEAFLNISKEKGSRVICADERAGILTYKDLRMRVILLAEYIKTLPGEYVGIMLPASVAAMATILATQLAGKVPLLVNWTVGPRHLDAVVNLSNVQVVLSSWTFLDRLENVDLHAVEDRLVMLEDVRRKFSLKDKLKALFLSKLSAKTVIKSIGSDKRTKDDKAVLLFTSGTENLPKGVPLTHNNILSNLRDAPTVLDFYSDDIFLSILPPFHAFGFTASGLFPLLAGFKVFYSPDPTDGSKLARLSKEWKATLLCGAPTFLKGILKSGTPEHFESLRICVTGAEKAPPELFRLSEKIGKRDAVVEGYGITECSPILTANRMGEEHVGVGRPLDSVELLVVHPETYEVIDQATQGLILARGPNVFSGYLNPAQASPFVEVQGKQWYKTGDLGHIDAKGNLIISGRQKRFVKIGGEMISLASIEDALLEAAHTKGWPISDEKPSLAVCAKEDPSLKTKIYLFTDFETTTDEVNQTLKEKGFSNLVKVSEVKVLPEIPIMGSGKIYYRELENKYLA
ncbi:AMP-binding protein [Estrella lausannensis]|uniref:Bifunctional acyl-[acyl carrier protein] synthetase/2-acylglycerophosphoethanolamine acyltransferase n=1 Tax=Estrella lausannensis TaxID=483423 RepID=A0A0H5DQV1_9BACT|nr:AMP-binding protein [Estrella lausannensis]CRX38488.1 bifunctional acyl-[acyl carrier protein] synthetase/2-acylglycerophosphoethanolamine acyltransferase [Estrella lausannensis]